MHDRRAVDLCIITSNLSDTSLGTNQAVVEIAYAFTAPLSQNPARGSRLLPGSTRHGPAALSATACFTTELV